MSLTLKTAPASEPLTAAQAKTHLRVTHTDDDTYIESLIVVARHQVEKYLRMGLIDQTWEYRLDEFPAYDEKPLYVPMKPITAVDSISYVDTDGDSQTWSADEYQVDIYGAFPRIIPAYGYSWPSTRDQIHAVTITLSVGYADANAVPEDIRHAMLLMIGELYENREESVIGTIVAELPTTARRLLSVHQMKSPGMIL